MIAGGHRGGPIGAGLASSEPVAAGGHSATMTYPVFQSPRKNDSAVLANWAAASPKTGP
jgi:hypothetical protein